ncbi:MAG: hypothetical protein ACK4ZJ_19500 [Allorhizobium sp.]
MTMVRFRRLVVLEAMYHCVPFVQRTRLHALVAAYIEVRPYVTRVGGG